MSMTRFFVSLRVQYVLNVNGERKSLLLRLRMPALAGWR